MKRKLIRRYGLLCLPFVCGAVLYGMGSYNIVSSLLFFVGGYVAIKNLGDYRKIKKNIRKSINNDILKIELDGVNTNGIKSDEKIISSEIDVSKIDEALNEEEVDDKLDECNNLDNDVKDETGREEDIVNKGANVGERNDANNKNSRFEYRYKSYDSIPGLKRTRRYTRVRKRFK